jgi:hypothetical protein
MPPSKEELPNWLIWNQERVRPPVLRFGLPLDEAPMLALAKTKGYSQLLNSKGAKLRLLAVGVAIMAETLDIDISRQFVMNDGFESIVEFGNNLNPSECLPQEDIKRVKVLMGTNEDPMWFLDFFEYRWKVM